MATNISIHALRVEGDEYDPDDVLHFVLFLSTPSGWRATSLHRRCRTKAPNFYPRPPGGGRLISGSQPPPRRYFYPRPPGGGRLIVTCLTPRGSYFYPRPPGGGRQEHPGAGRAAVDFYPRPPGGGRPRKFGLMVERNTFLSTPSGWRATGSHVFLSTLLSYFYPRPPGGGRHTVTIRYPQLGVISIHALRVEGD